MHENKRTLTAGKHAVDVRGPIKALHTGVCVFLTRVRDLSFDWGHEEERAQRDG